MGAAKDQWLADVELAAERFFRNDDEEEFTATMLDLGFYPSEIEDQIKELKYPSEIEDQIKELKF